MWTPGAVVRNHTFRNSISRECAVIYIGGSFVYETMSMAVLRKTKKV